MKNSTKSVPVKNLQGLEIGKFKDMKVPAPLFVKFGNSYFQYDENKQYYYQICGPYLVGMLWINTNEGDAIIQM